MKQFVHSLIITIIGLVFMSGCRTQNYPISGPEGELAYKITLPEEFDTTKDQAYGDNATLKVVEGENHTITRRRKQVIAETVTFFKKVFMD